MLPRNNIINEAAAQAIAQSITGLPRLTHLNLNLRYFFLSHFSHFGSGSTYCGKDGAIAIAESIKSLHRITLLKLDFGDVTFADFS